MKAFVQKIALIGAGLFLLLHTLMPHQHDANLSSPQHIQEQHAASDIFDFLELAFHLDLGEGHLEKYQPGQYLAVDFPLQVQEELSFDFEQVVNDLAPIRHTTLIFAVEKQWHHQQIQFRGPPTEA